MSFARHVLHREIRPPTPRSEATVCAVTMGNMAELVATVSVALLIVLLSARTIGYRGEQCNGGESVSQSPLMSKLLFIPERGNLRSWLPAIGPSRALAAPQASAPSSVDLDAAVSQAISAASLGK
jgi:hypothetical protein